MRSSIQSTGGADRHAEVAYEQIAPVYDDFTAHHNNRGWIDGLLRLGAAHGLRGDTVLDVGCGTGNSFLPLLALGWKVTAADLSPSMVELARAKALIFDSNTLMTYRTFFGERVVVEARGRRLVWQGRTGGVAEPGQISEATFEVEPLDPGSGSRIPAEVHRQRHHPEAELRDALATAGLEVAGLYGCTTDGVPRRPANEDTHTKSIYVTRRKRSD